MIEREPEWLTKIKNEIPKLIQPEPSLIRMIHYFDKLKAENERLKVRVAEEERICLQVIDERDSHEEYLNEIADQLGDETEWSSANHRGDRALELIEGLHSRITELTEALNSLANEASGFLSMAEPSIHGYTNMRCLQNRIDEARAALAKGKANE